MTSQSWHPAGAHRENQPGGTAPVSRDSAARHRVPKLQWRRTLKRALAFGSAAALVVGVGAGASVALADGQGPGHSIMAPYLNNWGGQQVVSWCGDNGRAEPTDSQPYTVTAVEAWQTSYLLNTAGADISDATTNAAVAALVHTATDIPHDDRVPVNISYFTAAENARMAELQAAMVANAGPYGSTVTLTQNAELSGGTATVGVRSAAGNYQPGVGFTADLIGGATWWDGTQSVAGVTDADGIVELPVVGTGNEAATVMVTFNGLNAGRVDQWSSTPGSGYQRTYARNPSTAPVSGSARFDHPFVVEFQPQVTTQTSAAIANAGDQLTDTLVVSVADGASWIGGPVTVTSTLYGPFDSAPAQSATPPAGAPAVASVTTSVPGPGTYVTPAVTLPGAGIYVWHESIPAGDWSLPWTGPFGVVQETTTVKWSPQVTTQSSVAEGEVGTALTDTLTVSGVRNGSTIPVTSTLYGPFNERPALAATVPAGAPAVGTVTTTVGNGTHVTPAITLPASGFYVWAETAPADEFHNGWSSQFGVVQETTLVKWTPAVSTVTSHALAVEGQEITDTLNVTGVHPTRPVVVTSTLYGPFLDKPASSATPPADAPVVGTVTTTVTGPGQYVTPGLTIPSAGYYSWWETIPGDDFHNPWQPPTWPLEPETTLAKWSPKVTTQTSVQRAELGAEITDTIGAEGKPGATVTVTSTLWGPFLDRPALVTREGGNVVKGATLGDAFTPVIVANPAAGSARPVATVTTEITLGADGTATGTSPAVTLASEGFYVWTEEIAETPETHGWQSDFGVAEETTVVPWTPLAFTIISDQNAVEGGYLTDQIWVEGLKPNNGQPAAEWSIETQPIMPPVEAWTGKDLTLTRPTPPADFGDNTGDPLVITVNLWGPMATKPIAGDTRPADAALVGTVEVVARNGVQISPEVGPISAPGYYVFQEQIKGTDSTNPHEGPWHAVTETAYLPPRPTTPPTTPPSTPPTTPPSTPPTTPEVSTPPPSSPPVPTIPAGSGSGTGQVRVSPAAGAGSGAGLASTGVSGVDVMLLTGLLLLVAGGASVAVTRRRKSASTTQH